MVLEEFVDDKRSLGRVEWSKAFGPEAQQKVGPSEGRTHPPREWTGSLLASSSTQALIVVPAVHYKPFEPPQSANPVQTQWYDVQATPTHSHTAGINRSNTAVRAVLEQPCSTGGRTGTVRPKQEPTGRTDLSDRSRLVLCDRSQELIGQACPTRRQVLWSDSACPTTGRTRLFEHRSNCRVRPVNAGSCQIISPVTDPAVKRSRRDTSYLAWQESADATGNQLARERPQASLPTGSGGKTKASEESHRHSFSKNNFPAVSHQNKS
ncbi:hypothetical protein PCASD_07092 [Puccinia coronata f. sp. avenae]|uniref:Uncharacterized protein n=1 Tax=Puccinia coronata f. sp. avenae TaxID=200324 RepID=A0A2N5V6Z7_9BASI|nr:hypothetical protein PCASD_07092 [Puccinia coronata f. sp. avenae]